ncbi:hypothetical protein HK104_005522, partial [Borealophlyctis nickersoniae]
MRSHDLESARQEHMTQSEGGSTKRAEAGGGDPGGVTVTDTSTGEDEGGGSGGYFAGAPFSRTITAVTEAESNPDAQQSEKLGTFRGVVVPTVEFIIRFGVIVGEAGIIAAVLVTVFSAACAAITMTSIAAIATNTIPRGGVYSVLLTSLGSGIGGGISIMYYLGLVMLSAIEIVGSVQGFMFAVPLSITPMPYLDQII